MAINVVEIYSGQIDLDIPEGYLVCAAEYRIEAEREELEPYASGIRRKTIRCDATLLHFNIENFGEYDRAFAVRLVGEPEVVKQEAEVADQLTYEWGMMA